MGFKIGNISIKNRAILAPMAGISNPSYIKICEEMGVGYAVTELISAEAIIRDNKKTLEMLEGLDKLDGIVAVQIFGSNPDVMARAAKIITSKYKNVFIDINMGCPVPKIAVKSQAGSALLKDLDKIKRIVTMVVNSVDVPVTVKIRSGWDSKHINAVEVAKVCESAGASAITIHARTRQQGYSGEADWNVIKAVKKSVKIPVIGNGDVTDCYLAKKMIDETGCDAVMIGRGAIGNPWLIKECIDYLRDGTKPDAVTIKDKIEMIKYHYKLLRDDKSEVAALLEIRQFIMYYLKGIPGSKEVKVSICQAKSSEEIFRILNLFEDSFN